jgi:hypothetical protein
MDLSSRLLRLLRPPQLTIELVPSPCWGRNVRMIVSPDQWHQIQKVVFDHAGDTCEVCGWPRDRPPQHSQLHCHEVWNYNDWRAMQRLEGFRSLCRFCHEVKHIGYASTKERYGPAIGHLANVNRWSRRAATQYADACFRTYERRSRRSWSQDLTVLYEWLERTR